MTGRERPEAQGGAPRLLAHGPLSGQRQGGGSALWLYTPTHESADRLIGLLADYDYVSWRYYRSEGAEVIRRNANDTSMRPTTCGNAAR